MASPSASRCDVALRSVGKRRNLTLRELSTQNIQLKRPPKPTRNAPETDAQAHIYEILKPSSLDSAILHL